MEPIIKNYSPDFLYVDKYHFGRDWVYKEIGVPYSLFRYMLSGSCIFKVDEKEYLVKKGDVFYIPQFCTLYCEAKEEVEFISVRFLASIQLPDTDMLKMLFGFSNLFHMQNDVYVKQWFEELYNNAISNGSYKRMFIKGYLNLICAQLAKVSIGINEKSESSQNDVKDDKNDEFFTQDFEKIYNRVKKSENRIDSRVRMLVDYITLHPEENPSREEMCKMLDISESTLRRIFKECMGKSIRDFLHDVKMMHSTHLLVTTNLSVSEIAYQLGYENVSYFILKFRTSFGVSPMQYRKSSQNM